MPTPNAFDWTERRTLVTGATGVVGSWLCDELIRRNAYVVAFVRDDDPLSRFYADGIWKRCAIARGDLADYRSIARAMNEFETEVVFHLGAQTIVGSALRDPMETFESNIRGTYNLLEAARRLGPVVKSIVVASSDKAYGESEILPYTEDLPLRGRHPYDVSKSCTDLLSDTYAHTYGLNVTVARCGNIYGGGDLNWSRIVPGTIRSLLSGTRPILRSDGTMIRDYIYVRDVIDAYLALAEQSHRPEIAGEAFNFSPESECTVFAIVAAIGQAMGLDPNPHVVNTAHAEILRQTLDSSKARRLLGWSPAWSLADGLRETVAWYRTHLAIPGVETVHAR
ncbi:MAG: GDP-mannose 4,6-dehydratase [Vulcanimicrobiaceae bacterium]